MWIKATYWQHVQGSEDSAYHPPRPLDVLVEDASSPYRIKADIQLELGDYVFLGQSDERNPRRVVGARRIRDAYYAPNLRNLTQSSIALLAA